MAEEIVYEIEVRVRSATDESVRHMEGPLDHKTANDVAAEIAGVLDSRSRKRMRMVPDTDR